MMFKFKLKLKLITRNLRGRRSVSKVIENINSKHLEQMTFLLFVAMEEAVVYEAVAVHDFADYIQGCVNVLDEEWARSASSRLY